LYLATYQEAVTAYSYPRQLRFLFAYLLLDLPTLAIALWDTFRDTLSANFALDHNKSETTLLAINQPITVYHNLIQKL
jgi:hypothetical protein